MTYYDMKVRLAELLLMRVDKMTMAHSIEARVPFLDHRIVEFSFLVPDRFKVRRNVGKYVLKKAAEGILPDEVIYRKKQGLNSPIVEWLRAGKLSQYARQAILESPLIQSERGIFNRPYIEDLLSQHISGRQNRAKSIWALLILVLWHSEYFE
jgi:asparagine synthase (glutamine-hydrolysing)